jgi:hypothetical protein
MCRQLFVLTIRFPSQQAKGKLIVSDGSTTVKGVGTEFEKDVQVGETLALKGCNESPRVEKIISNTEMLLKEPFERPVDPQGESYKVCHLFFDIVYAQKGAPQS